MERVKLLAVCKGFKIIFIYVSPLLPFKIDFIEV